MTVKSTVSIKTAGGGEEVRPFLVPHCSKTAVTASSCLPLSSMAVPRGVSLTCLPNGRSKGGSTGKWKGGPSFPGRI